MQQHTEGLSVHAAERAANGLAAVVRYFNAGTTGAEGLLTAWEW